VSEIEFRIHEAYSPKFGLEFRLQLTDIMAISNSSSSTEKLRFTSPSHENGIAPVQ